MSLTEPGRAAEGRRGAYRIVDHMLGCMGSRRLELAVGRITAEETDGLLRARGIPYGRAPRFGVPLSPVPEK